jgi:hypothetical protein
MFCLNLDFNKIFKIAGICLLRGFEDLRIYPVNLLNSENRGSRQFERVQRCINRQYSAVPSGDTVLYLIAIQCCIGCQYSVVLAVCTARLPISPPV